MLPIYSTVWVRPCCLGNFTRENVPLCPPVMQQQIALSWQQDRMVALLLAIFSLDSLSIIIHSEGHTVSILNVILFQVPDCSRGLRLSSFMQSINTRLEYRGSLGSCRGYCSLFTQCPPSPSSFVQAAIPHHSLTLVFVTQEQLNPSVLQKQIDQGPESLTVLRSWSPWLPAALLALFLSRLGTPGLQLFIKYVSVLFPSFLGAQ